MNRRLTGDDRDVPFRADARWRASTCWPRTSTAGDIVVTGNTVIDAFLETAARDDLPVAAALERARPDATGDRRDRAPPRESRAYARDVRGAARDRRTARAARRSIGRSIRRRTSRRSRTKCSTAMPGVVLVDPIDYAEMVAAVRGSALRADRFGRPARGGAVPRQAGAGDARGDRAARGAGRRDARAGRARPRSASFAPRGGCSRIGAAYAAMARAAQSVRRRPRRGAHRAWLLARLRGGAYPEPFEAQAVAAQPS